MSASSEIDLPPPNLANAMVCYSANATVGVGGQGEFLRQMVYALDQLPHARVLSRGAKASRAECVDIPRKGGLHHFVNTVRKIPFARRRRDLLTLADDLHFDARLASHVGGVTLFDGVMGQCCRTFKSLSRSNVPLILTALNTHIDTVRELIQEEHRRLNISNPPFVHPRMRVRVREEIERATRIWTVSALSKQSFIDRGVAPSKIDVVLPAVDLAHFHPVPKKDSVFRVLAVITIDPRKGAYYLLEAFKNAAIPNSELVIIGATGDRWSHQMINRFKAELPNFQIQSADVLTAPVESTYGQASVFVHPAIEDGFALAVAQALACGLPVITTRNTGASELIVDGQNGYVLECRDVDGMVELFRLLARDDSLRMRLGAAAPQAVSHLGYPTFAQNVARMYSRALAN